MKNLLLMIALCALGANVFAQITSVSFTATPRTGCGQIMTAFTTTVVSANPVTYNWDFGDGTSSGVGLQSNPGHLYLYDPLKPCFTVTLTVTDGVETKSFTRANYICVYKKPTAQFTFAPGNPTSGCPPLTVQLIDQSTTPFGSGSSIVSWVWSSQGGSPQTVGTAGSAIPPPGIPNPTFTWNAQGSYGPTLTVTDNNGCKETIQKNGFINVTPTPRANFTSTAPNACTSPHTVSFTNTSVSPAGTTYKWLINGNTYLGLTPPAQTLTTGSYDVTLIAIGAGASPCNDTLVMPSYINVGGSFNFAYTPSSGCLGTTVEFTAPVGSSDHVWDFGDNNGGVGPTPTPSHAYLSAGCFTPTLTATLPGGCRTTAVAPTQICISSPPTPTFTVDKVNWCSTPIVVNFTSAAPPSPSMTCAWTFNNSTNITGPNFSNTCGNQLNIGYNPSDFVAGIANPTLTWTDTLGCSGTFSLPINYKPLTANFNLAKVEGCVPYTTGFIGVTTAVCFASPNTTNWEIDGAPYATGNAPPAYNFATAGTHTVRMSVTNTLGCSTSVTKTIKGGGKPTAAFSFSPTTACAGTPILFNLSGSFAPAGQSLDTNMELSYGDGEIENTFNPLISHIYQDTISYCRKKPHLIVYSNGCASDTTRAGCITILPAIAKFEAVNNCADRTLYNLNAVGNTPAALNSIGADNCSWQITPATGWTFEQGIQTGPTAQAGRVGVRFTSTGTYTVTLTVTNLGNGCTQSVTKTITVADPVPSFTMSPTQGCAPLTINLTNTTTDINNIQSTQWSYVQAPPPAVAPVGVPIFTNQLSNNATVLFPSPGAYDNIVLTVTDVNGCTSTTAQGGIQVQGASVDFTSVPTEGCTPTQVAFTSVVTPFPANAIITNYAWDLQNNGSPYNGIGGYYEYSGAAQTTATYIITQAGNYSLKHTVITQLPGGGICKDSITKLAFTGFAPNAYFTAPSQRCTGQPFTVVNTSAGTGGITHTWYESVNGGQLTVNPNYTSATPTIAYATQGTYILCDEITENTTLACKDSICRQIIVANPIVDFTGVDLLGMCPPLTSTLTSTSQNLTTLRWEVWPDVTDVNGNFVRVRYTEADGTNASVANSTQSPFSLTIAQPGTYTVKLFGTTASGCIDSLVRHEYIKITGARADISISPTTGCAPLQVTYNITNAFGHTSIAYYPNDVSQQISVHNTNASSDSQTHTYTTPGTYYPTFLLDSGQGCQILLEPQIPIVVDSASGWAGAAQNGNMCVGDSINIHASSTVQGALYQWQPSPDFNPTMANDSSIRVSPNITTTYTVNITDPNGCTKISTVTVDVLNFPTLTLSPADTSLTCVGNSVLLTANAIQDGQPINDANAYTWNTASAGLSTYIGTTTTATPSQSMVYEAVVTGVGGCTASATAAVNIAAQCVFPGDANNDGIADNFDLLPIAFNNNATGVPRVNATTLWRCECAAPWLSPSQTFNDCNGNGMIEATDTLAILANYNRTHNGLVATNRIMNAAPIYLDFGTQRVEPTRYPYIVTADVRIGEGGMPVQDLAATAFTITYNKGAASSAKFKPISTGFLGANIFHLNKDVTVAGDSLNYLDIAIARTDGQGSTGDGIIGSVEFTITDNIIGKGISTGNISTNITDIYALASIFVPIPLTGKTANVKVENMIDINAPATPKSAVAITPNPSNGIFRIRNNGNFLDRIILHDALGREVYTQIFVENTVNPTLFLEYLPKGVYFATIYTNNDDNMEKTVERIIIR
jgi:PKD repeat protein